MQRKREWVSAQSAEAEILREEERASARERGLEAKRARQPAMEARHLGRLEKATKVRAQWDRFTHWVEHKREQFPKATSVEQLPRCDYKEKVPSDEVEERVEQTMRNWNRSSELWEGLCHGPCCEVQVKEEDEVF